MSAANFGFMIGSILGFLLVCVVPIVVGIILLVRSSRVRNASAAAYSYWAQFTQPGQPVIDRNTGQPVVQQSGTGLRVAGIILVVLGGLLLLGRLASAAAGVR